MTSNHSISAAAADHLTESELDAANEFGESLRLAIHERALPDNNRVRAAAGCLAIAQDHHHAILQLLGSRLYASAFALVRVLFEAYVRGEWLAQCATDDQVEAFLNGSEPIKLGPMIAAMERTDTFDEKILSAIKKGSYSAMCGYTHTGGLHVQRYLTSGSIEANHSRAEILEVLTFSEVIVALSVVGILAFVGDDIKAQEIAVLLRARTSTHARL